MTAPLANIIDEMVSKILTPQTSPLTIIRARGFINSLRCVEDRVPKLHLKKTLYSTIDVLIKEVIPIV
jgi:hypothetical protein